MMPERRRFGVQRFENLDLHARVGDMILPAHDMRHGELDVVDNARKGVEKRPVRADQDRVRKRPEIDGLVAADQIIPGDMVGGA